MFTRLLLIGLITILPSQNIRSQIPPDSIKTVAIYSSKKSFFENYSIDSLVSNLNLLNTNNKISYYKNTEDRSRKGFYADYLVNLDLTLKLPVNIAPKWETTKMSYLPTTETSHLQGRTSPRRVPNVNETQQYVEGKTIPGEGKLLIKIIEKSNNEKVTRKTFTAKNNDVHNLEIALILLSIEYLLALK